MRSYGYLVLIALLLTGCTWLMAQDFDKATRLAEIRIQSTIHVAQTVLDLPQGDAEVIVAVPNQHCRPVDPRTTVRVRLEGEGFKAIDLAMKFGELTWSHGMSSCHAYGYLYDSQSGIGRKLQIPSEARQIHVSVTTSGVDARESRGGSVWLAYSGRVPTNRVFGD